MRFLSVSEVLNQVAWFWPHLTVKFSCISAVCVLMSLMKMTHRRQSLLNTLPRIYVLSGRLMRTFVRGELMKVTFQTHTWPENCHCCLRILHKVSDDQWNSLPVFKFWGAASEDTLCALIPMAALKRKSSPVASKRQPFQLEAKWALEAQWG